MLTNITYQVEMENRIKFLAKNDALTTLPNYHSLHEHLNEIFERKEMSNFALFYIDLDNFHEVEYTLGHQISDEIMKHVANRIVRVIPTNSFLAKFRSETFALVLHDSSDKRVMTDIANEIIKTIG